MPKTSSKSVWYIFLGKCYKVQIFLKILIINLSRFYDDLIYDVEELEDIKLRVKINKFLKNCTNVVAYPEPWP